MPRSNTENHTVAEIHRFPTPNRMYRNYLVDRTLNRLRLPKKTFFLEIGCGTGEFLANMAARGYQGRGIDMGACSIEMAKKRLLCAGVTASCQDMMSVSGTFDMVFAFEVLEHIEDDVGAMAKVNQLLCDDGYFMLSVPGRKDLYSETDSALGHVRRYEKTELVAKLQQTCFHI